MKDAETLEGQIDEIRALLSKKLGARGRDFPATLARARRRLPKALRAEGQLLAAALPMMAHPKLSLTLDTARLDQAARALREHLGAIDLAERRKTFWLGVLGAAAFNLLLVIVIFLAWLAWRDQV